MFSFLPFFPYIKSEPKRVKQVLPEGFGTIGRGEEVEK
jgi:hypothetical protein